MPQARATRSTVEYLPEFGRAVRIAEYDRPMRSDDEETGQTVAYMDELATADASSPAVTAAADEALDFAGLDTSACDLDKAQAVFWWLKRTVEYVATPGTSHLVDQTLITPTAVLAMPEPIGDCPQFSMLADAMLRALEIDSRYVTIAAEELAPDQWSHVYNVVRVGPDSWLPFDSSNGPSPGAEYAKPFKKKIWPRIGPGPERRKGKILMMRTGPAAPSMRNRSLRTNLGDVSCDADGNCYDDSTGTYTPGAVDLGINLNPSYPSADLTIQSPMTGNASPDCVFGGTWPNCAPPTGANVSSGSGLNTLAQIVGNTVAPIIKATATPAPYYVTNPATGQSALYNPATGTFANPTAAALGSLSPTTLLLGALFLGGLLFLGGK